MSEINHIRVIYYGRNDVFTNVFRDRCIALLSADNGMSIVSINDAIEAHQCKLTVEGIPELFEDTACWDIVRSAQLSFSKACQFVGLSLSNESIVTIYEQVETQYLDQFWQLMSACAVEKKIEGPDLENLLERHPRCIGNVLGNKKLVERFSERGINGVASSHDYRGRAHH